MWIDIPQFVEHRGRLATLEFGHLPFIPRRLFHVTSDQAGVRRGGHAHRVTHQLLICVSGRVEVELRRHGETLRVLCEPTGRGLLIEAGTWASQTYLDAHSTLLVLCSHPYDPADYIQDPDVITQ